MDMATSAKECRTHTVLVVEDDALLALSIEDVLRNAGIPDVAVCPTVALAMAELERKQPDAIILDVHLGDREDGWALAEIIACIKPDHPRIIFSTAAPEEIPPEVAKLGAIFEKPYDPAMLLEALCAESGGGLFARFRRAWHNSSTPA
mgnify:CR=1 FL=1